MAILARINTFYRQKGSVKISNYLDPRLILFLDASTRNEAIDALVDLLAKEKKLPNKAIFKKAILDREELVSTGIGMGVAVPHAKLKSLDHFFIAIGIQHKKGIDWDAIDKAPVRLIFIIGGPDDRQSEYLQILSQLTIAIKDQEVRKELMRAANADEVMNGFLEF